MNLKKKKTKQNKKLGVFTISKPKTPKLDQKKIKNKNPELPKVEKIKLKTHKLSKINKNLKKTKWKTLKVDKNKTREPQAHKKNLNALSSQNKIVKILWNKI